MDKKCVLEIVGEYLRANGYDGLTDEEECGCGVDDLAPCQGVISHCVAAYRHLDKYDREWYSTEKRQETRPW
jgi:hypothetical protein